MPDDETALEYRLRQNENLTQKNSDKLEGLCERVVKAESNYENIMTILTELKNGVKDTNDKLDSKLDEVRMRPAKHYDTLITSALSALVSGVVAFVITFFHK